jgi:hypothetical protein
MVLLDLLEQGPRRSDFMTRESVQIGSASESCQWCLHLIFHSAAALVLIEMLPVHPGKLVLAVIVRRVFSWIAFRDSTHRIQSCPQNDVISLITPFDRVVVVVLVAPVAMRSHAVCHTRIWNDRPIIFFS